MDFKIHFQKFCFTCVGNNLYGDELYQVLQAVKRSPERMAYILMDKLHPAPVQNIMVNQNIPLEAADCVGELGVYGVYVRCVISQALKMMFLVQFRKQTLQILSLIFFFFFESAQAGSRDVDEQGCGSSAEDQEFTAQRRRHFNRIWSGGQSSSHLITPLLHCKRIKKTK